MHLRCTTLSLQAYIGEVLGDVADVLPLASDDEAVQPGGRIHLSDDDAVGLCK